MRAFFNITLQNNKKKGMFSSSGTAAQRGATGSHAAHRSVWWLITLWLRVSRACQRLWPHEVWEHLGMSVYIGGVRVCLCTWVYACVFVSVWAHLSQGDSEQTFCLNLTSSPPHTHTQTPPPPPSLPPKNTQTHTPLTFKVPADTARTKSEHSHYMTRNTPGELRTEKSSIWGARINDNKNRAPQGACW